MAAIDFITQGHLCRDTIELITAIPFPQRTQLLNEILDPAKHGHLVAEYINSQTSHVLLDLPSMQLEGRSTTDCRIDLCEILRKVEISPPLDTSVH
jgi:hypothetical protein